MNTVTLCRRGYASSRPCARFVVVLLDMLKDMAADVVPMMYCVKPIFAK